MFKRKITQEFYSWKASNRIKRKALVVKGLRQVGKTFSVMQFARDNYKNVVYMNFKNNSSLKRIFDSDFDVDRMTVDISANLPDSSFVQGETVMIFDEIQECTNARASIKAFMEDGRYDIICTGSLLGIRGYNRKRGKGVPTGSEHILVMKPMDFEEFLWAKGVKQDVIDYLNACFIERKPISEPTHRAMLRYFREYICVGGLPHIVDTFLSTSDMNAVYAEQKDIIEEYRDDFGKHLDENENEEVDLELLARINRVFDSIPAQLAKENKKFQYSHLEKKGRAEKYASAIQWLVDFGIVSLCYNLSIPHLPLELSKEDDVFKIYLQDSGLLIAMMGKGVSADILSGNLGFGKGAIYENIIAYALSKMERKLFYYRKDSGLEIDFVTEYRNEVTLIEVKAVTGNIKSSKTILKNYETYKVRRCIKFGEYNIGEADGVTTLPYYLVFMLDER